MTSAVDLTKRGGAKAVPPQAGTDAPTGTDAHTVPTGTDPASAPTGKPARIVLPGWLDPALRVTGFLLALALAAVTAAFEVIYAPLFLGTTRAPVSIVAAVALNLALVWFTTVVTGRRLTVAGPALVWVVVMVVAASRTREGDLMLTDNNWVGIGTMLAGSVAWAVGAYRLILTGVRPATGRPVAASPRRSAPDRPA